jgi:phosphatidylinositol alpha-1,6-mannosyltransferase
LKGQCLLLSEIFPPKTGGSGRWFWDLYTRLDKSKVIVVTDTNDNASDVDNQSGLRVQRIPLSSKSWGILSFTGLFFYFSVIRHILQLVRNNDIESIHCGRTLHEGIAALIVKFLTGTPYLCYVHGEDIEMCWSSREYIFLINAVLRKASILICNSENSATLLRKWKGAENHKIRVLHPAVDASAFCPATGGQGDDLIDSNKKVILTVSRLQPRKGHDVLIRAIPEILKRHPDVHYVIVGSGQQRNYLMSMIKDLDLEQHVSLVGECTDDEMLQWYRRSDLFVLPNRQVGNDVEGFGIVLLEAQACATAVIAGDSGGTRETLEIDKTGYILDCRDTEALISTISDLFDNPGKLVVMGENARRLVLSKFDWPRVIDSAQMIFAEVTHSIER